MPQGTACSRADISGNGRLACEPEFNYTGCEQSRLEMERWKILHSAKDLGVGIVNNVGRSIYRTF